MNRRALAAIASIALAGTLSIAGGTQADASVQSRKITGKAGSTYCVSSSGEDFALCLYYDGIYSAAWGLGRGKSSAGDANLGNNVFDGGLGGGDEGDGAGVWHSDTIACGAAPSKCYVYDGTSYTGDYEWITSARHGALGIVLYGAESAKAVA